MGMLVFAGIFDFWEKWLIPVLVILVVLAFIIVIRVMASRYKKIPPNQVGIFFGRKYSYVDPADSKTKTRGFRIVSGGGPEPPRVHVVRFRVLAELKARGGRTHRQSRGGPATGPSHSPGH